MKLIHTDSSFVVVEKPGGLLSVPGRGPDKQDCVANRLKKLFPGCIEQPAVHRLDMDTSGLMLLALTVDAHRNLSMQFENRSVKKRYVALLDGVVPEEAGEINLPFRLDPDNRPYQVYDPVHGKWGVTTWRRLKIEGGKTRVEFFPHTGRTHQLRLHSAHEMGLQFPIIGDRLYGIGKEGDQLMLHAAFLGFHHPENGKTLEYESAVPF